MYAAPHRVHVNAAKGIGRYVSWALFAIRELSVASPIYREPKLEQHGLLQGCCGAPLINMILTKSQRRRINHGCVESGENSDRGGEIYGCVIIRAFGGEE
ncbi:hypothetical protein EAG_01072 [Camponotus floridanus]|uniref:Uncharacterized protein n=1 Tax=Camponotus floridanus TaxID=104421 RepID=E2AB56_CAMFO|nr:hypothetical protein EAG_01072 [Camponotus floridanus]